MTLTTGVSLASDIDTALADRAYGLDAPMLSFNTAGGKEKFLDLMKTAPQWIGHLPGQWGGLTYSDLEKAGAVIAPTPSDLGSTLVKLRAERGL